MLICSKCHTSLPDGAKFCMHCGEAVVLEDRREAVTAFLRYEEDLVPQLSRHFFDMLEETIKSEQDEKLFSVYSERIYTSGFRDILDIHIVQLSLQVPDIKAEKGEAVTKKTVEEEFRHLIDLFLIYHCNDINKIKLPEAILKHRHTNPTKVMTYPLVLDFLDFNNEQETVYLDFKTMPPKKFENATTAYLKPGKLEKIIFICDQSLLGNGKNGFAMTDDALYWKIPYKKPNKVRYREVNDIRKTEDWITINGHFFNASPSLNLKMMRLLRKLKR